MRYVITDTTARGATSTQFHDSERAVAFFARLALKPETLFVVLTDNGAPVSTHVSLLAMQLAHPNGGA